MLKPVIVQVYGLDVPERVIQLTPLVPEIEPLVAIFAYSVLNLDCVSLTGEP